MMLWRNRINVFNVLVHSVLSRQSGKRILLCERCILLKLFSVSLNSNPVWSYWLTMSKCSKHGVWSENITECKVCNKFRADCEAKKMDFCLHLAFFFFTFSKLIPVFTLIWIKRYITAHVLITLSVKASSYFCPGQMEFCLNRPRVSSVICQPVWLHMKNQAHKILYTCCSW